MKARILIILVVFMFNVGGLLFGQTTKCKLYIDELKKGDTLKISIKFFVSRDHKKQDVCVYIDEFKKYQALLNSDSVKNKTIELTKEKIQKIRLFETSVRNQSLKSNMPLNLHSLAKYEISYKRGSITYYSKEEYYSLFNDL